MTNAGIVFVGELDLEGGEMVKCMEKCMVEWFGEDYRRKWTGNICGISVEYNGNNFPKIISCENQKTNKMLTEFVALGKKFSNDLHWVLLSVIWR